MKKTMGIILIATSPLIAGLVLGICTLLRWLWHGLVGHDAFMPWGHINASMVILLMIISLPMSIMAGVYLLTDE